MNEGITQPPWIYESPDGGITVYHRLANSTERELTKVSLANSPSEWVEARRNTALRRMRWYKMLDAAVDDPILSDMIERVETYYALKY